MCVPGPSSESEPSAIKFVFLMINIRGRSTPTRESFKHSVTRLNEQACNEANADRVGNNRKYNRDRSRLPLECSGLWSSVREDYVGLQANQFFREYSLQFGI